MKALMEVCNQVNEFPPGHYWCSGLEDPRQWYQRDWTDYASVANAVTDREALRQALEDAVVSHLMTDVPYGVLLSGGLDSSITAALAAKHAEMRVEDHEEKPAWWPRLHSFAIGLEGSPDLAAAQKAADHIGTVHHGFTFTIQEGLDALEEVIYHLETYDVTTIRAATPMFLMARKIRAMGIKMVLSGEGADEIFGGYLYFHKAPDPKSFHEETVRKLSRLHSYDCLRANKSMSAWGVEARVPFLDKEFLDVAMSINPADKMITKGRIEKQILREAFSHLLPESIAWRQKEQFSDGVGYGWIDAVKDFTAQHVSDADMARAAGRFPFNTPASKEAYWVRSVFEQHFPLASAAQTVPGGPTVACSTPEAVLWDEALQQMNDPSGRAMKSVHQDAY
jgi:asparagine synthase (glutamine-hydrolysing)